MNKPLCILLVDDNPDDRALVTHELRREFPGIDIEQAGDANGLERALSSFGYDLVITDFELKWTDGLQVLAAIKARNPDCPVIMFSGSGDEHTAVTAMKAGLDDYIVKAPAHFARLSLAVRQALDRVAGRVAMRNAEARYRDLFENLPLGLYRITPNGRILDTNPALAAIAGCPDRETLLTHNASEFFINEKNYRAWQAEIEAHGTVVDFEGPGRKLDGRAMWVRNNVRAQRDANGKTLYYEGALEDITRERQAIEKLRRSELLFRQVVDSLPVGVWVADQDGKLAMGNPAGQRIWEGAKYVGIEQYGEYKGRWLATGKPIAPEDWALARAIRLGETSIDEEVEIECFDGTRKIILNSAVPIRDERGAIQGAIVVNQDITARKRAETELYDRERQLTLIADNLPGLVSRVDRELRYLFVNAEYERWFGLPRSAIVGRRVPEIIGAEAFARFEPYLKRAMAGERVSFESMIKLPSGETIYGRARYVPDIGPDGEVQGHFTLVTDVTETKLAAERAHKLSSAIEQTADSVIITDRDGVIEYVNPAFEIITGYSSAEALGRKPSLLKSGKHNQAFYRDLWGTILRGEPFHAVFTNRRKDGNHFYEQKTITPLRDAGGDIAHFVSTGKDISERIHAENTVRASEEHLRTIIDTEPDCIKLLGADGKLIDMNAAGLAMIEADSLEQVTGKSMASLILPEHREAFQALTHSVLQGNKSTLVFEIQGLKGTRRWLETQAVPMTTRSGDTVLLGITRDITERRRAEQRLSFLAHHDELTGLPNRTLFNDRLNQAMIEAERHERLVGVVFMDLDRFKDVNDTLGHEAGDLLLKGVAERLLGAARRGDTVARLSGDEFTLVLADMAHVDDASRVLQKILDVFTQPFHIAGRDLFMSASLGITLFPFDTHETQALLRYADIAMYRAKEAGRNMYQFYAAEMTAKAVERIGMENDLRLALKRGEFVLHYQPIVSCSEGRIIGVEALVRWQRPDHGLVPPLQFIPLAEETGLIVPLGEWVLHAACAQLGRWKSAGFPELRMAVNLSVRQFRQKGLTRVITQALTAADIAPRQLELEITESVLAQGEEAEALLREVRATGVRFSIDDFGTGYSSLSYLKRFPIDTLKIDQSFVRDIPGNADDTAITMAIIALAHSLGMRVVAEGVETAEQLGFVCAQACDSMQGYYLSKPLPAEAVTALLREKRCICPPRDMEKTKPRKKGPRRKSAPARKK